MERVDRRAASSRQVRGRRHVIGAPRSGKRAAGGKKSAATASAASPRPEVELPGGCATGLCAGSGEAPPALAPAPQASEHAAAEVLERLQALFDPVSDGVLLLDEHNQAVLINHAAGQSNGFHNATEAAAAFKQLGEGMSGGLRFYDVAGKELAFDQWPINRALRHEEFAGVEITSVDARGGFSTTALYSGIRLPPRQGGDWYLYLIQDITARHDAERAVSQHANLLKEASIAVEHQVVARTLRLQRHAEQLRRLANQLTSAEQRERKRLAALLHDHLQQLLVACGMRIGLARSQVNNDELRERLNDAQLLLHEALSVARELTVELCPPVLSEAGLAAAMRWLGEQFEQKHHFEVLLDIDDAAEPAEEPICTFLFEAARELLFNVVKHAGVPSARLTLERGADNEAVIRVEDSGSGFDEQQLERDGDGEGFGLFSIRERLTALGGSMLVKSAPGSGTSIELRAPMEPAGITEAESRSYAAGAREGHQPGIRVLIVDDHPLVREGVANMLAEERGFEVVAQAADGQEALRQVELHQPDVVLMDYQMPGLSGVQATRLIRQRWPKVRVVGLSGRDDAAIAQQMQEAGAYVTLSKGSDPSLLVEAILECAGRPR